MAMPRSANGDGAVVDRPHSHARLRWVIRGLVIALWLVCVVVIVALLAGFRVHWVTSGSMEPLVRSGSLIVTRQVPIEDIKVGDVITVSRPYADGKITHRVVSIEQGDPIVFVLKGDANATQDPFEYEPDEVERLVWPGS